MQKMNEHEFHPQTIRLIADFLKRRKQCVKFNSSASEYIDINVGAPQGTKLGPILWLIYINDLLVPEFKTVKYADDSTFYLRVNSDPVGQSIDQPFNRPLYGQQTITCS